MNCFFFGIMTTILVILESTIPLKAELLFRGGYLDQTLSTSSGYNQILSERYGAKNPKLSGTVYSITFRGWGQSWGVGMEIGDLVGGIKYKTLNGDNQENKMKLQNTIVLLGFFLGKSEMVEVDFGLGTNKLTREFYGYNDSDIVSINVSSQEGTQKSSTKGQIQIVQVLYRVFGTTFRFEVGGRYSISKHTIPSSDSRPGYDSVGVPTDLDFDLGGAGLVSTLTFRF